MPNNPTLALQQLSLRFNEKRELVLKGIDLSLYPGEFVVLIGPNGSGKSSLLKTIAGQHSDRARGEMSLLGRTFQSFSRREMAQNLVTLSQRSSDSLFFSLTVWENCLLYEDRFTSCKSSKVSKEEFAAYLGTFHPQLPYYMDSAVKNLSGGEMQCLAMALCLRHPCALLLLDEHTSAMSHKTAQGLMEKMLQVLKDRATCVFMITHNLSHALTFGTRLLVLQEGVIVKDYSAEEKRGLTVADLIELIS